MTVANADLVFYVELCMKRERIEELHQMTPYWQAYDAKLPGLMQQPRNATILKPTHEWHKQE